MKNKILIVLIAIIVIAIGALGYYTYFIYEKEEVIAEKVELSKTDIANILDDFYYQKLLIMKDRNVNDITEDELLYIGYYGLGDNQKTESTSASSDCTALSGIDEIAKCVAKDLGLADEKIAKMDTTLWDTMFGGSTAFGMFSKELLENKIMTRFGINKDYNKTFNTNIDLSCGSLEFVYDNKVGMFFTHDGGGCTMEGESSETYVTDGNKDGDTYTINIVKGIIATYEKNDILYYKLYSESNPESILFQDGIVKDNTDEGYANLINQYKDKLDKYELIFKKVGNAYQFESVNYKSS